MSKMSFTPQALSGLVINEGLGIRDLFGYQLQIVHFSKQIIS